MSDRTITPEVVAHIATLARLKLADDDRERLTGELSKILGYMSVLNKLDTTGIAPTDHMPLETIATREDLPRSEAEHLGHDVALREAPKHSGEGFVVPSFVEELP